MKDEVVTINVHTLVYKFHDGILEKVEEITDDGCTHLVVIAVNGIPESATIVKL